MILFPDQEILLEEARQKLRELPTILAARGITRKPRILIQASCGFGKTVIASFIAKSLYEKNKRSWFVCHRDFLLAQTSMTYKNIGLPHSFMAAKMPMDASASAHICMIGSMKSRMDKVDDPVIALWDEGHHSIAKTWADKMDSLPETIHIAFSATPSRLDGKGLDTIFDAMVCGPSSAYLIQHGRLADYEYYIPSKPDFSNVSVRSGEYASDEACEAIKAVLVGDIIETYRRRADGLRAVYFATSVELSKRYADAFNAAGISAAHMDADTPSEERTRIAQGMARGEIKVTCNVFICAEGYDLAAQAGMSITVDVVGLCFRTKSLGKLIQCAMRSMRAGARGIILDHGNNYEEHDWLPDDDIEWSLDGSKREDNLVATYQCAGCGATLRRGSMECSVCGCDNSIVIREIKLRKEIEHKAGELERIDRENRIKAQEEQKKSEKIRRNIELNSFTKYEQFLKYAQDKRFKNAKGWAGIQWNIRKDRIQKKLVARQSLPKQLSSLFQNEGT